MSFFRVQTKSDTCSCLSLRWKYATSSAPILIFNGVLRSIEDFTRHGYFTWRDVCLHNSIELEKLNFALVTFAFLASTLPSRCMREHTRGNPWQASLMHRNFIGEQPIKSAFFNHHCFYFVTSRELHKRWAVGRSLWFFCFLSSTFSVRTQERTTRLVKPNRSIARLFTGVCESVEWMKLNSQLLSYRPRCRIFLQLLGRNKKKDREKEKLLTSYDFLSLIRIDWNKTIIAHNLHFSLSIDCIECVCVYV